MKVEELDQYKTCLPDGYFDVLKLSLVDKLSQREISSRLKISLYRTRHYLSHGQFLIKKEIGSEELNNARKRLYVKIDEV